MPAEKIRGDYEALGNIAQGFNQNAEAIRQMLQRLKQAMGTLENGDWIGAGATKFYEEMNSQVVPALTRLGNALANASQVTSQMSQTIKFAEDEASKVFRVMGGGEAPGPGGGAGGEAPGPGGAGSGGSSGTGGSAGSGGGSGGGGSSGTGSGGGGSTTPTGTTGNTSADKLLNKFDPAVRDLVAKSPTLVNNLEQLEKAGWTVKKGTAGGGSFANRTTKTITIDPNEGTNEIAATLAHEGGHALYGNPPYHAPTSGMTKDQYVDQNVREKLVDEGNAQFQSAVARAEIKGNGGADIGIPGSQTAKYQQVYDDYKAGTITKQEAVNKMADLMGNERTSNTNENYKDYYGKSYKKFWTDNYGTATTVP